jgi:hypothetical protein
LRYQKLPLNLLLIFSNIGNRRHLPMTASTISAPGPVAADWTLDSYNETLARLRQTTTREGRAALLDVMADQAGGIAAGLHGQGTEDGDRDPLAWHETATFLRRLAAAQRGMILAPAEHRDQDGPEWGDLACASTAAEHAAAVAAVLETFAAGDDAADMILVRPGALLRFREAASACTAGHQAGAVR